MKQGRCLLGTFFFCFFLLGLFSRPSLAAEDREFAELSYSKEEGYQSGVWIDRNGNEIEAERPEKKGMRVFSEQALPSSYDLRTENRVTSVKRQGSSSACWAFAALGSIESYGITNKYFDQEQDFSEAHLIWFADRSLVTEESNPLYGDGLNLADPYKEGGNWLMAVSMLSRYCGTAEENRFPFYPDDLSRMGDYLEEERYESSYHLTQAEVLDRSDRIGIKRALMERGALMTGYYNSSTYYQGVASMGSMCYYYAPAESGNIPAASHAVLICGWDDDFPKENFKEGFRPKQDGAWLAKNDWGTSWGMEGYFWISYEEMTFDRTVSFLVEPVTEKKDIYQYDGMAYGGSFRISQGKEYAIANHYQARENEQLTEVSFYTLNAGMDYRIEIYAQEAETEMASPEDGTLLISKEGYADRMGYHTISLETEEEGGMVELKKGQEFFVKVTYFRQDGEEYRVPIEYSGSNNPISYGGKKGESFCKGEDETEWKDAMEEFEGCYNFCIKAFAQTMAEDSQEELEQLVKLAGEYDREAYTEESLGQLDQILKEIESYLLGETEEKQTMEYFNLLKQALEGLKEKSAESPQGSPQTDDTENEPKEEKNTESQAKESQAEASKTPDSTASDSTEKNSQSGIPLQKVKIKNLSSLRLTLGKGETFSLQLKLTPKNTSDKIKYVSSRSSVAKVSGKGKIKAKARGTAKISRSKYLFLKIPTADRSAIILRIRKSQL